MSQNKTYRLGGLAVSIIAVEVIFWILCAWLYFSVKLENKGFKLEHEDLLWSLAVLPAFSIAYYLHYHWKKRAIKSYADARLLDKLMPTIASYKINLRYILMRLGLGLMLISLLNPQFGEQKRMGSAQGIDIIFALDISKSMETRDLSKGYSRIAIAKRAINKLLEDGLKGDRAGLVIFAGNAYKQVALTQDYEALMYDLGNINTDMLRIQGTNIANAIEVSLTSFNKKDKTNKAIIVVSDGENHEADAVLAAKNAFDSKEVKVYTIGMGTPRGARIPKVDSDGNVYGYIKNNQGNTVLSKLNEPMLQEIAEVGNGAYIKATSTDLGLDYIIEDLNKMEKTNFGNTEYTEFKDQFLWFLIPGALLYLLSSFIQSDFMRSKKKYNLFEA